MLCSYSRAKSTCSDGYSNSVLFRKCREMKNIADSIQVLQYGVLISPISIPALFFRKIPEEFNRRSVLFHNLRQYLPYQTYIHTTFYPSSGLTCLMEVSTMFYVCRYCVFTWYDSHNNLGVYRLQYN